ncbi:MAG: ligase-associated DNA damage response exonuclease [Bacteroidia bacterium]
MSGRKKDLLQFTDGGIYCPQADVYLDPRRKVKKALISHAHSDHARYGCESYLSSKESETALRLRLGKSINLSTVNYNEEIHINGVKFSFYPAGHIIGSSQIRVEYKGEVWVYSGDYKLENDGFSTPFESVKCHTFITESTFGLPVYRWKPQDEVFSEMNSWWKSNSEQGICTVIVAYSLGKAQRILKHLDKSIGQVFTHSAITAMHSALRDSGFDLPPTVGISEKKISDYDVQGGLILVPPAATSAAWLRKHEPYATGIASGWMGIRGSRRRMSVDRGFVLSDHADWPSLNRAVKDSGAERVIVTHGYKSAFSKWLRELGYDSEASSSDYYSSAETEDQ